MVAIIIPKWLKTCKIRYGWRKGKYSPSWKGNKALSKAAGHLRAQTMYPIIGICELCNKEKAEDRHHIDINILNNDRNNILFVCKKCHAKIDGRSKRLVKMSSKPGVKNGRAKLKTRDVLSIIKLKNKKYNIYKLIDEYKVSESTIRMILRGETWKHLQK